MAPKKLLLAEDDLDDQDLFHEYLKHRKEVILLPIAENGVALFDYLQTITDNERLPDLIVLDQNMPKRNGVQTLKLLKETAPYKHIPVVVYSTYADEALLKTCAKTGASLVVPKPISKEGYHEMLDSFLKVI